MSDKAKTEAKAPEAKKEASKKPDLDPELEKQLREAADTEDKLAHEMKEKCQLEFSKRASLISDQFNLAFDSQMSHMGDRFHTHLHDNVTTRQTDVLRTNKVFRDVSRDLGEDWKPVFEHLMKDGDPQKVKVEMAKIERQKPFMQPFKALNSWKDLAGDKFDIRLLLGALNSVNRHDLSEKVFNILDNEGLDSLYSMEGVGSGVAGGVVLRRQKQEAEAAAAGEANTNGTAEKKPAKIPSAPAEDPIGDRALLKIAKALDKNWQPLAEALELSEEDLNDAKESGDNYHGGFKSMFTWRDTMVESGKLTSECVDVLKAALTKVGQKDLAENIKTS